MLLSFSLDTLVSVLDDCCVAAALNAIDFTARSRSSWILARCFFLRISPRYSMLPSM